MRVLLVEDDVAFGRAVFELLATNAHRPAWCRCGTDALTAHHEADLVLLNLDLPDMDGLQVLGALRQLSSTPVLTLANRGDENSAVDNLGAGADDHLAKPVRLRELLARIDALARRAADPPKKSRHIEIMDVSIDRGAHFARIAGKPVRLIPTEFTVLDLLASRAGRVVTRQQIMAKVWGDSAPTTSRKLNVHMTALRAKLDRPSFLCTARGYGYRLGKPSCD